MPGNTGKMTIEFGPLVLPLYKQLKCKRSEVEVFQIAADSITRLNLRGFLTDQESHRARKRLIKAMGKGKP